MTNAQAALIAAAIYSSADPKTTTEDVEHLTAKWWKRLDKADRRWTGHA